MISGEATIASGEFTRNGCRFSRRALEEMIKDAPGKPIWDSFETKNVIGEISWAHIDNGDYVSLGFKLSSLADGNYVVPMVSVNREDYQKSESGFVIKRINELLGCSITSQPADKNLVPISIKEDE